MTQMLVHSGIVEIWYKKNDHDNDFIPFNKYYNSIPLLITMKTNKFL